MRLLAVAALLLSLVLGVCRAQPPAAGVYPVEWVEVADAGVPFIRVTLADGKARLFAVDTGSPATTLDRDVAKELRLPIQTQKFSDTGEALEYVTSPATLGVDVLPIKAVPFVLTDMSLMRRAYPEACGIIGTNVLFNFALRLNYTKRRIEFLRGAKVQDVPQGTARIPLAEIGEGKYEVEVTLDDRPVKMVIDTGSGRTFLRTPEALKALRPVAALKGNTAVMPSDSGLETRVVETRLLRLKRLTLAGQTWSNPVVEQILTLGKYTGNALGNDFLRRFRVLIDLPRQTLYLTPDAEFKENAEEWVGFGTELAVTGGKVVVSRIFSPSPAEAAGVKEGDEIVSAEGRTLAGLPTQEVAALFASKKKVGAEITLELRRPSEPKTRTVRLRCKQLL